MVLDMNCHLTQLRLVLFILLNLMHHLHVLENIRLLVGAQRPKKRCIAMIVQGSILYVVNGEDIILVPLLTVTGRDTKDLQHVFHQLQ